MFYRTSIFVVAIAVLLAQGCAGNAHRASRTTPLVTAYRQGDCNGLRQQFEYKQRTIAVDERGDPPTLMIDGKPIAVQVRLGAGGKAYAAGIQIYAEYSSLNELAKALVDSGMLGRATGRPVN